VRSVAQFAVSTFREELSISTQTYLDAVQTVRSSAIYSTTLRLINSFGSLVIQIILIGCTLAMSAMVLIVEGASRLAETKRVRSIMNPSLEKDSNERRRL